MSRNLNDNPSAKKPFGPIPRPEIVQALKDAGIKASDLLKPKS